MAKRKVWELNWQFDSRPLKVENHFDFLTYKQRATYRWKVLNEGYNEGYNFASEFIAIRGLHAKLWALKVVGVRIMGILRPPFGSPETKCHLDVAPMERRKEYYKGEGGGFLQVWAVVSLVSPSLLVAHPSTKSAQTMH
jgi:hypothetical protein